jgi:putative transposase
MKRRRRTPEEIVRKLREADRLLGEGQELPQVVKQLEVSGAMYHRWRAQYGGMKADDVQRLRELEAGNDAQAGGGRSAVGHRGAERAVAGKLSNPQEYSSS